MKAQNSPFANNHVTSSLLARYTLSLLDHSEGLAVALAESDIERILDLSHKIKGSAGGYGFDSISHIASIVEEESLNAEADISLITDRVEDLIDLCKNPRRDTHGGSDVHHE